MQIQAPKGTKDVLPGESYKWQYIEKEMRDLCRLYGINELRTPIIEHTELFMRGVGDTTDIVQKEMYTFKDKGDRSITLKPEGTSGMVRAFLENRLFNEALPQKMYYLNAPVFRYEKPQAGITVFCPYPGHTQIAQVQFMLFFFRSFHVSLKLCLWV